MENECYTHLYVSGACFQFDMKNGVTENCIQLDLWYDVWL